MTPAEQLRCSHIDKSANLAIASLKQVVSDAIQAYCNSINVCEPLIVRISQVVENCKCLETSTVSMCLDSNLTMALYKSFT